MNCLQCASSKEIKMSKKVRDVQFGNYQKQMPPLFAIYGDFKPNLKEIQKPNKDNVDVYHTDKC